MFLLLSLLVAVLPVSTEGGEIMWGTEAKPHSHPYMACLKFSTNGSGKPKCGGFLVAKDIVMTAAHCYARNMSVILGAHDINDVKNAQIIPVIKVIPHNRYNNKTKANDIMLLKLEREAELNKAVNTIPLPKSQDWVKPKQVCTVAGWGRLANCTLPDKLQEVKLEVQESDVCRKLSKSYNKSIQLCVGNPKEKKATGKGDSGGPFVCHGVAQGIVSYQLCTKKPPRVFTRISSFIPWIKKTMKLLQQP